MYLSDLGLLIRTRWLLVLLGLLVTGGLVLATARLVPNEYEAKASVLLLPPKTGTEAGTNPYLSLGGLQSTADIVARAMMSDASIASVVADGGNDDVVVETDKSTSGPLLLVTSTDHDPAKTMKTLELVLDQIPRRLDALQAADDVSPSFRITSSVVARQETPTTDRRSQIRTMLVVAALGVTATLFGIALIDGRARRRQDAEGTGNGSADDVAPPAPAEGRRDDPDADVTRRAFAELRNVTAP